MKRESWGSRLGFMFAVAGSAVGLANIWRFPYIVGKHGGAAFILIYLFFLFSIGFSVFLSEILIGRKTQSSPSNAFALLGHNRKWRYAGLLTIITGFLVSGFYSAVAGWILGYLVQAVSGNLTEFHSISESSNYFDLLIQSPSWGVIYHFIFLFICTGILFFGVRNGIERGTKIMMPLLFVTLFLLVLNGLFLPNANQALSFLFHPNWNDLTPQAFLIALGQAFFTLSLGQGTMVTYGSYLKKKENVITTTIPIVLIDLLVSLLSAIAVFTIVFSVGLNSDSGPSLLFSTLPLVFSQLPGGYFLAITFFLLVTLAAITSEISAMEPMISYLNDKGWKRHSAVITTGMGAFLLGVPSALSYGILNDFHLFGMHFLDFMDFICSSILIPIGGLLAVIMVGWIWGINSAIDHMKEGSNHLLVKYPWIKGYFWFCVKYLAPILIIIIFLNAIGLI